MMRWMSIGLVAVGAMALADEAANWQVSQLRLPQTARATADALTISAVLDFGGADERLESLIGAQPLATPPLSPGEHVVTHDQVWHRLDALGVNRACVLLSGALSCKLTVLPAAGAFDEPALTGASPSVVGPQLMRLDAHGARAATLSAVVQGLSRPRPGGT